MRTTEANGGRMIARRSLDELMRDRQLTNPQLALVCGVDPNTVSFWRTGRSHPRRKAYEALLAFLKVKPEQLDLEPADYSYLDLNLAERSERIRATKRRQRELAEVS